MKGWVAVMALGLVACSGDDSPPADMGSGGSLDAFIISPNEDMAPAPEWTKVRVIDETPTGQGLPLDAVEHCNVLGMACARLPVTASSDSELPTAGIDDGPNSQDDSCTEDTFVRLAGDGATMEFGGLEAEFVKDDKVNIWTGDSACPLIEAGDKAFSVVFLTDDGAESDPQSCTGTCTVSVP